MHKNANPAIHLLCLFSLQTSIIPFFQIGLFGVLLSVPINLVPYLFLWVYDKLIWLSEPVFLTIEAVEVVRISVRTSLRMSNRIQEQPFLMKVSTKILENFLPHNIY